MERARTPFRDRKRQTKVIGVEKKKKKLKKKSTGINVGPQARDRKSEWH